MLTEKNQAVDQLLTTRILLACGVAGPFLFNIVYWVEGAIRPGYNPWRQAISALSLSNQGWLQIINFIVCGLLIIAFAIGLRVTLRTGNGATWGPILLAAVGVGLIVAGVFVTDPAQGYPPGTPDGPTIHPTLLGTIHFAVAAPAVFGLLPLSCFVLARRFALETQWKGGAVYSLLTGILMIAFFVAFIITGIHDGPAGLMERFSIMIGMAWIALFALRLLSQMRSSVSSARTAGGQT